VAGALRAPHWSASAQDLRIFFQSRKKNFGIQDFEKNLLRQNLMSPWGKVKIYAEVEILQYFKGNIKAIYVVPSRYRRTHVAIFIIEIPLMILIVFGVF